MRGSSRHLVAVAALFIILSSCKTADPAPELVIQTVRFNSVEFLETNKITDVEVMPSFIIDFNTNLDVASINANNIRLTGGTTPVVPGLFAHETFAVVSLILEYDTDYTLAINGEVRSDRGAKLSNPTTIVFRTRLPPPPPFTMATIKCGTVELLSTSPVKDVPTTLPFVVTFSQAVDASTATANSIFLQQGTTPVLASISVSGSAVTVTPNTPLAYSTSYSLQITTAIKSTFGVAFTSATSVPFTTAEPPQVFISEVVATPTENESITLKNNTGGAADISGWTLGDKNDPTAYRIPNGTVLNQGQGKVFMRTTLGFQINDTGEVIYLRDAAGNQIDTWSN